MTISDPAQAVDWLAHCNCYRLAEYWRTFLKGSSPNEVFCDGCSFAQLIALYQLDYQLSGIIFEVIHAFELSLRARWVYETAHAYGANGYENVLHFTNHLRKRHGPHSHALDLARLDKEFSRSPRADIQSYLKSNQRPPCWIACDLMTLGTLIGFSAA